MLGAIDGGHGWQQGLVGWCSFSEACDERGADGHGEEPMLVGVWLVVILAEFLAANPGVDPCHINEEVDDLHPPCH